MTDPEMQARIDRDKLATRAYAGSFPNRDPEEVNAKDAEYNRHVSSREWLGRPVGHTALHSTLAHDYEYRIVNLDNYDGPANEDRASETEDRPESTGDGEK